MSGTMRGKKDPVSGVQGAKRPYKRRSRNVSWTVVGVVREQQGHHEAILLEEHAGTSTRRSCSARTAAGREEAILEEQERRQDVEYCENIRSNSRLYENSKDIRRRRRRQVSEDISWLLDRMVTRRRAPKP